MRELAATDVIALWERDRGAPLAERALALLAAAGLRAPEELPVGERDLRLLELRELTFGGGFAAVAECPACSERLTVELTADDVRRAAVPSDDAARAAGANAAPEATVVEVGGRVLRARLPTGGDLAVAAQATDEAAARTALLDRCVLDAEAGTLDAEAAEAVAAGLAEADPAARIDIALGCPACGHAWAVPFDIASFLCAEVDACARRLVHEVHALASAYGWTEPEVLALSAGCRAAYLELVGA